MTNVTGNITLSGVTDREMARVWETKAKHGDAFTFNPQGIQVVQSGAAQPARPGMPPQPVKTYTIYNNVQFSWKDQKGLEIVQEVIAYFLRVEESTAAAQ